MPATRFAAVLIFLASGGCALTPPAEFQAYPGERLPAAEHAVILNTGGAVVVQVDSTRTGTLIGGGAASTIFVLPGMRKVHAVATGYGASADSAIFCLDAKAGGVYAAMATRLDDPIYYASVWIRDNHTNQPAAPVTSLTAGCE